MKYKKHESDGCDLISQEYYDLIVKERLDIKYNILPKIRQKVQIARDLGDLSENAEYQTELSKKVRFEQRLNHLDFILSKAVVFKLDKTKYNKVYIGTHVTILDTQTQDTISFHLVSTFEVDPTNNKISYKSAIAKLIAGQTIGYIFTYRNREYKIISIQYDK